jgi:hypothetical protein
MGRIVRHTFIKQLNKRNEVSLHATHPKTFHLATMTPNTITAGLAATQVIIYPHRRTANQQ